MNVEVKNHNILQTATFANPLDQTVENRAFHVTGVNFAGSLYYKISPTKEGKTYTLLFSCSLTGAIHLQTLKEQRANKFIQSLKLFNCKTTNHLLWLCQDLQCSCKFHKESCEKLNWAQILSTSRNQMETPFK